MKGIKKEVLMTNNPKMTLKGVNGQLLVYDEMVVIKRKGALAKMTQGFFKGDKTIYINQLSGVQVKKAGMLTNGYIQFTLGGGNEKTGGILEATKDENAVMYKLTDNDLVEKIKAHLDKKIVEPAGAAAPTSVADELIKLKGLLEDGILTQEEFDDQKQKLL